MKKIGACQLCLAGTFHRARHSRVSPGPWLLESSMTDVQSRIAALSAEQRALLEARVAAVAAAHGDQEEPIRRRTGDGPAPVSFAQQREWALERFRPSNNIIGALRLDGDIDLDLLARALTELTARHEVLRTTVEMVDRVLVQVVHPVTPVPVQVVDLSALDAATQRERLREHYLTEVTLPFPADQAQRVRATALRVGPDSYVVFLIVHHASSDGWSTGLVMRDSAVLYLALRDGREPDLPPLPIQYSDFAAWQRERMGEERMAGEIEHWRGVLEGIPPRLELPTDRPVPVRRAFAAGADSGTGPRPRGEEWLCCWFSPRHGVRVRVGFSRQQTLREVLRQARDVTSAAFYHQDLPFDRLIEEFAPKETSQTPLIRMMINVLTIPGGLYDASGEEIDLVMPNLRISPEPVDIGPIAIDVILIVQPGLDAVDFLWHYSSELFEAATVARLADQFGHVLNQLITAPDTVVGELSLLGSAVSESALSGSAIAGSALSGSRASGSAGSGSGSGPAASGDEVSGGASLDAGAAGAGGVLRR